MAISHEGMIALARRLPIPVPWDRKAFVNNLAELRGRPITLIPTDAGVTGGPCGLWLIRDHDDLILHQTGTSEYHIDQIVCHEIAHMVLGHRSVDGDRDANLYRDILSDIDPNSINAVLGRSSYADDQERDAEMFASVMMIAAAEAADRTSMMRSVFFRHR